MTEAWTELPCWTRRASHGVDHLLRWVHRHDEPLGFRSQDLVIDRYGILRRPRWLGRPYAALGARDDMQREAGHALRWSEQQIAVPALRFLEAGKPFDPAWAALGVIPPERRVEAFSQGSSRSWSRGSTGSGSTGHAPGPIVIASGVFSRFPVAGGL